MSSNNISPYGDDINPYPFDYYEDDDLQNSNNNAPSNTANQQILDASFDNNMSNDNLLSSLHPGVNVENFSNDVAATLHEADMTLNSGANTSGLGLQNYLPTTAATPRNNGGKDVTLNAPDTEGGVIENASEMDVGVYTPQALPLHFDSCCHMLHF